MKRAWTSAGLIAIVSLVACAFCLHEVGNSDLFWHLRAGEILASTGEIVRHDLFSYTREGAPWINLEWLSGLVFYLVHRMAGFEALSALSLSLGLLTAFAIFSGTRRLSGSGAFALLLLFLVFLAGAQRFELLRAELFGFLLFSLTLSVSLCHAGTRKVWLLIVVAALWANFHPSALLGPAAAALLLLFAIVGSGWRRRESKRMALAALLGFAALLVNPFFTEVYSFPLRELGQPFMISSVSDWSPPGILSGGISLGTVVMIAMAASAALLFLLSKGRRPIALGALSIALVALSLAAERFTPFATIALAFMLAALAGEGVRLAFDGRGLRAAVALLCVAGSLLVMVRGPVLGARLGCRTEIGVGKPLGVGFDSANFPVEAVDFMRGKIFGGRVFNDMAWGGYLIWRLWPKERVFIDTRTALYGDEFIKGYSDALFDKRAFDLLQERYGFNYVIYDAREMASPRGPLHFLRDDPGWLELPRKGNAALFLKIKRAGR